MNKEQQEKEVTIPISFPGLLEFNFLPIEMEIILLTIVNTSFQSLTEENFGYHAFTA